MKIMALAEEYEIGIITDAGGPCTRVNDTALAHVTAVLSDSVFFSTLVGNASLMPRPDNVKSGGSDSDCPNLAGKRYQLLEGRTAEKLPYQERAPKS